MNKLALFTLTLMIPFSLFTMEKEGDFFNFDRATIEKNNDLQNNQLASMVGTITSQKNNAKKMHKLPQFLYSDANNLSSAVCHFSDLAEKKRPNSLFANLSLGYFTNDDYVEQEPTILNQCRDGIVLHLYKQAIEFSLSYLAVKLNLLNNVQPQFKDNQIPTFSQCVLQAPVVEEILFTLTPNTAISEAVNPHWAIKKMVPIIMPLLFGYLHIQDHHNFTTGFTIGLIMFSRNFLNHKYLIKNPKHITVPIIEHMLGNAMAYYFLKNK